MAPIKGPTLIALEAPEEAEIICQVMSTPGEGLLPGKPAAKFVRYIVRVALVEEPGNIVEYHLEVKPCDRHVLSQVAPEGLASSIIAPLRGWGIRSTHQVENT
jgi:hypothetical protein